MTSKKTAAKEAIVVRNCKFSLVSAAGHVVLEFSLTRPDLIFPTPPLRLPTAKPVDAGIHCPSICSFCWP